MMLWSTSLVVLVVLVLACAPVVPAEQDTGVTGRLGQMADSVRSRILDFQAKKEATTAAASSSEDVYDEAKADAEKRVARALQGTMHSHVRRNIPQEECLQRTYHIIYLSDVMIAQCAAIASLLDQSTPEHTADMCIHIITDTSVVDPLYEHLVGNDAIRDSGAGFEIQNDNIISRVVDAKVSKWVIFPGSKTFTARLSSRYNNARYYLPDLFPELDKAIYVDHDQIFFEDIVEMWEEAKFDNPNHVLSVAIHDRDTSIRINKAQPLNSRIQWQDKFFKGWDIDWEEVRFNPGVMVMMLSRWRKGPYTKMFEEMMEYNSKHKLFLLNTQPAFNLVFSKHFSKVDARWNLCINGHTTFRDSQMNDLYMVHWTGASKPHLIQSAKAAKAMQNYKYFKKYAVCGENFGEGADEDVKEEKNGVEEKGEVETGRMRRRRRRKLQLPMSIRQGRGVVHEAA